MNGEVQTASIIGIIHTAELAGSVSCNAIIGGMHTAELAGYVSCNAVVGQAIVNGVTVIDQPLPYYEEEYNVIPSTMEQILHTKYKAMIDNVIVEPIPYYKTTNLSGGYTAIIGG